MIAKKDEPVEIGAAADPTVGLATVNDVRLVGRISDAPQTRALPSGDEIGTFRLIVDRLETTGGSKARVDVIDCIAWSPRLRAQVALWAVGDVVEVRGALRRRFFRSAAGRTESRTEVEVFSGRRRRRAAT